MTSEPCPLRADATAILTFAVDCCTGSAGWNTVWRTDKALAGSPVAERAHARLFATESEPG